MTSRRIDPIQASGRLERQDPRRPWGWSRPRTVHRPGVDPPGPQKPNRHTRTERPADSRSPEAADIRASSTTVWRRPGPTAPVTERQTDANNRHRPVVTPRETRIRSQRATCISRPPW